MRTLAAIALANLPLRWWGPFEERFPLNRVAWISGIVTMVAGFAVGIPGFLNYLADAADGMNQALIDAQSDLVQLQGPLLLALPVFLFTSPAGLVSLYLAISGLGRFAAAYITDEPQGDWLLTGVDGLARRIGSGAERWDRRKTREKLEGPEGPDRLVTGDWLQRPDIELAVIATRRKDWPRGAYLVTSDGTAYRVGDTFDLQTKNGLRAVYPVTELRTGEAIRHAIPFELPPLWRHPRT